MGKEMLLSPKEREAALQALPSWRYDEDRRAIVRSLRFQDFTEAFVFMTRVAEAAEEADHHPDWSNSWNRVEIALTTHSADGLTEKDLTFAARIDALASLALPRGGN